VLAFFPLITYAQIDLAL